MLSISKLIVIMCLYNGLAAVDYLQCTDHVFIKFENKSMFNLICLELFGTAEVCIYHVVNNNPTTLTKLDLVKIQQIPNLGHPTVALVPVEAASFRFFFQIHGSLSRLMRIVKKTQGVDFCTYLLYM
ncbi:hypothetical protein NQ318_019500 [Aromia moschata]|uniref:Uncharacterized protein n=1 Tax=Aromia moschata TaxID=1265417 RepID=A0AAV8XYY4_9CUCU|nr:hypothetical protein NQ318_019500 [Aromia moschata]